MFILRLQMESCRVYFCSAVVSYVCTKIQNSQNVNVKVFCNLKADNSS